MRKEKEGEFSWNYARNCKKLVVKFRPTVNLSP